MSKRKRLERDREKVIKAINSKSLTLDNLIDALQAISNNDYYKTPSVNPVKRKENIELKPLKKRSRKIISDEELKVITSTYKGINKIKCDVMHKYPMIYKHDNANHPPKGMTADFFKIPILNKNYFSDMVYLRLVNDKVEAIDKKFRFANYTHTPISSITRPPHKRWLFTQIVQFLLFSPSIKDVGVPVSLVTLNKVTCGIGWDTKTDNPQIRRVDGSRNATLNYKECWLEYYKQGECTTPQFYFAL